MRYLKDKYLIVRRTDDNTYDVFYKIGNGKLDFVSNHDTYDEAMEVLKPATPEEINQILGDTKKAIRNESFEQFFNNL
jgi:hypothetical protein